MPPVLPEVEHQLTAIYNDLVQQVGIESMAEAMQRAADEQSRAKGDNSYGIVGVFLTARVVTM